MHVIARMNLGGTSSYLYNLITNSSPGIEHLLVMGNVRFPEIEDSRVKHLPNIRIECLGREINLANDVRARGEVGKIIRAFKPDVINSHTFKAGFLARTLFTKIPNIHTFHGHLLDDPEFRGLKRSFIILAEKILAHRSTILTTTGDNVRRELIQAGIRHSLWRNIYPGLDPLVEISKASSYESLNVPNLDQSKPSIAWHSRFAPVKNVELVMKIAELLPEYNFLVSGGGPLYEKYRSVHPKNVYILGWQAPEHVFGAADILISTSFNEGLSFSLIEASMLGKPCIATKVGAAEEIVIDGKTGFLVNHSPEIFVDRIRRLIDNPKLRFEMGCEARNYALERFGMGIFVERYMDLIEEAIQRGKSKTSA